MIEHFSHITNSPEDSMVLGKKIATYLKKGDILGLVGDLGTGKTTWEYWTPFQIKNISTGFEKKYSML